MTEQIIDVNIFLGKKWVLANIAKTDTMHDVCSVLANISTKSKCWVIDRVFCELIDFFATSDDYITLLELLFCFHITTIVYFLVKVKLICNYF